jgi:hypothetical protein
LLATHVDVEPELKLYLRTIQDLEAVGVDLYLDQQHLDTTTPTGSSSST